MYQLFVNKLILAFFTPLSEVIDFKLKFNFGIKNGKFVKYKIILNILNYNIYEKHLWGKQDENNNIVAQSISGIKNLEKIKFTANRNGKYRLVLLKYNNVNYAEKIETAISYVVKKD